MAKKERLIHTLCSGEVETRGGYVGCPRCGRMISHWDTQWVPVIPAPVTQVIVEEATWW